MSTLAGTRLKIHPLWKYGSLLFAAVAVGFLYAKKGPLIYMALFAVPLVAATLMLLYRYPKLNLYLVMVLSFMMATFVRYIPVDVPWSLGVDTLLLMALLMPAIKHWHNTDYRLASRSIVGLLAIWMGYITLQIFNPEAVSFLAWFYVMRSIALYPLLIVLSSMILLNSEKDFDKFFKLWLIFTLLGVAWGIKQSVFGVTHVEQMWLEAGAKKTHVLFGKLRIFSYYYDAGTYGTAMGQFAIVSLIMFLGPFNRKWKTIYLVAGLLAFYGLMISGTRGALAVPTIGALAYLIMIRKVKLIIIGVLVLGGSFSFLKYTKIGQSNYNINRMRTALNPEDASLNTRMRNRAMLSEYLRDKPFGGGVGTSGYWGRRFSRGTWLSQFEPDGLYTQMRAETGIVGRNLYVGILLLLFFKGVKISWNIKNKKHQTYAMAMLAGYAGILMANYGNPVMTQFPNIFVVFMCLSFVYSMKYWREDGVIELPDGNTPLDGGKRIENSWNRDKLQQ